MTTNANAPVGPKHLDEAEKAALCWRGWGAGHSIGEDQRPSILAHAQTLANLEAANNRLAEIYRIARQSGFDLTLPGDPCLEILTLASGHTPTPCPGCAAKDEAMAAFKAEVSRVMKIMVGMDFQSNRECLAQAFIIPPADPVAEALKAALVRWCGDPIEIAETPSFTAAAINEAVQKERAGIVAWLRGQFVDWNDVEPTSPSTALRQLITAIEAHKESQHGDA